MNKINFWILAVVCCLGLSGCGNSESESVENNDYSEFSWPDYSLATEIPAPDSLYGNMELALDNLFSVTIVDMSSEEFDSYVDECIEAGYSTDSSRYDDFYMAYNDSNIHLIIDYSEDDRSMSITVSKSDEEAEESSESEVESSEETKESITTESIEEAKHTETAEPIPESTEQEVAENITVENDEDFAAILTDEYSGNVTNWFYNRKGSIIEFDGCIADVALNDDYSTRYNILVYGCDWDENYITGPNFQFYDTSAAEFGDFTLPGYISAGSNVHIVAEIKKYDADSDCIRLIPIEVTSR